MFNIRLDSFLSNYLFRSAKNLHQVVHEYMCSYWIIKMDLFFTLQILILNS
jgi:hypothetical protein